jgi:NAD(P)-dependent dehydrogenase (short-subunit alcohol dehydrogenase family)
MQCDFLNQQKEASMDLQLNGKKALISGSTKGIGLAIAIALAREGAHVVINGRSDGSLAAALEQIRSAQPNAAVEGFNGDLSLAGDVDGLRKQVPSLDILVNNLGIYEPKPFEEIPDEEWRRFFEVNVLSGVRLSRAYLPGMKERDWGRIIFVSSESGIQIPTEMIHYGMTKTAQLAVSRGIAETCAGTKVTVNAILPGPTHTEGVDGFVAKLSKGKSFAEFEKEFFQTVRPASLLKRFATPEEVANLAVYVCSPLSSATNGAALRVDGGVVRSCF